MLWIVLFIILNGVDFWLTRRILKAGGRELNPIIRKLGLWQVKVGGIIVVLLWWLITGIEFPIHLLNLSLLAVCIWNLFQYFTQKKGG